MAILSLLSFLRLLFFFPNLLFSISLLIEWHASGHDLSLALSHLLLSFLLFFSIPFSFSLFFLFFLFQWLSFLFLCQYYSQFHWNTLSFPIQWRTGKGQRVLLTGVNYNGIGYEIAKGLVRLGYNLVIVDIHHEELMKRLCSDLQLLNSSSEISYLRADLTNYLDISKMIQEYTKRYDTLDILINNAGGMLDGLTSFGYSKTVALCYHAPIILTREFLPLLTKSLSQSRIVMTCSSTSDMLYLFSRSFHLSHLSPFSSQSHDPALLNYARAKYCLKYYVYMMHQKFLDSKNNNSILINCFHPGAVASNIFWSSSSFHTFIVSIFGQRGILLFQSLFSLLLRTPQVGSLTGVYLAASSDVTLDRSGEYYFDCEIRRGGERNQREEDFIREIEIDSEEIYRVYKDSTSKQK